MSTKLAILFERTMPSEQTILARMERAEQRAAQKRTLVRRRRITIAWTTSLGVAASAPLWMAAGGLGDEKPSILAERSTDMAVERRASEVGPGVESPAPSAASGVEQLERDVRGRDGGRLSPAERQAPDRQRGLGATSTLQAEPRSAPKPAEPTSPTPAASSGAQSPHGDAASSDELSPPGTATWESAAQALRGGQKDEAARLIRELSQSDDPETRDSATLVRLRTAIVELESGGKEVRLRGSDLQRLRSLSQSGATASIRASARRLLERVE